MVRGLPRAMLATDASVGKAEKDTIQGLLATDASVGKAEKDTIQGLLGFETTN